MIEIIEYKVHIESAIKIIHFTSNFPRNEGNCVVTHKTT